MSNTHTSQNQKPETLASEIISDLKKENERLKALNERFCDIAVQAVAIAELLLREGDLENENA